MIIADKIVDWDALGQALYISVGFGLAVLLVAGVAVNASLRAVDSRENGGGSVAAYGFVTIVCVAALIAAVVTGIYIMTQK
jgi:ABC-type nickel/cobalt efflux system permease component RcnA